MDGGPRALETVVSPDAAFWSGKKVFLTGHTGFKGTWLWSWLLRLGAKPIGFALPPPPGPSLWREIGGNDAGEGIGDIRNRTELQRRIQEAEPEIVLHLAAQALVRYSYAEPIETIETNVVGTMNVLDAIRRTPSVKAVVSVTTDKVYRNREWVWAYREDEALGGHDPYSASKACAEIVSNAWRSSFLSDQGVMLATARAGNVIGGGDWSADRLLPDCIEALRRGEPISIRNPRATRPWQHVLEPLSGYLLLAEKLVTGSGTDVAEAWNFGPSSSDVQPVSWIAARMVDGWGQGARWEHTGDQGPHEAGLLAVDSAKAIARLGWRPRLELREAIDWTIDWAKRHQAGDKPDALISEQIRAYEQL